MAVATGKEQLEAVTSDIIVRMQNIEIRHRETRSCRLDHLLLPKLFAFDQIVEVKQH